MFAARFAKAEMTMIAMITVPPKKMLIGLQFIFWCCVQLTAEPMLDEYSLCTHLRCAHDIQT